MSKPKIIRNLVKPGSLLLIFFSSFCQGVEGLLPAHAGQQTSKGKPDCPYALVDQCLSGGKKPANFMVTPPRMAEYQRQLVRKLI
jgi:hypothetical protein